MIAETDERGDLRSVRQRERRLTAAFGLAIAAAVLWQMFLVPLPRVPNVTPALYTGMIIAWALTVQSRIVQRDVRRLLLLACVFMGFLFLLRVCRIELFYNYAAIYVHLWYAYYIPMTAVSVIALLTALRIAPTEPPRGLRRISRTLWLSELVLCIVIMTNGRHRQMFRLEDDFGSRYTYGWLYFVVVMWCVSMGLGSLIILLHRCRLSASRKQWYVPALAILSGFGLIALYSICGGAPTIGGRKIYMLHEAFCFTFIAGFESVIRIGLIPSNSGYETLFRASHMGMAIVDRLGRRVYQAADYDPAAYSPDHVLRESPIHGGLVRWTEDMGPVRRLNAELRRTTEALEDENELIRQETAIRQERVRYETMNRLYDRIAGAARSRAAVLDRFLRESGDDESAFRAGLPYALLLGGYIKRMGNLMLLSDSQKSLSAGELALAVAESLEYLRAGGIAAALESEGDIPLPPGLALLGYELFETAAENAFDRLHACLVRIDCRRGFLLELALDLDHSPLPADWQRPALEALGASLTAEVRDDTVYLRLTREEAGL